MYPAEPRLPGGAPREEGGYGGAGGGGGRVSYHGHHGSGRRGERGGRHEGWRGGEKASSYEGRHGQGHHHDAYDDADRYAERYGYGGGPGERRGGREASTWTVVAAVVLVLCVPLISYYYLHTRLVARYIALEKVVGVDEREITRLQAQLYEMAAIKAELRAAVDVMQQIAGEAAPSGGGVGAAVQQHLATVVRPAKSATAIRPSEDTYSGRANPDCASDRGNAGAPDFYGAYMGGKVKGVFVDVGAGDGVFSSKTAWLGANKCWTGLAIEPTGNEYPKLERQRLEATTIHGAVCEKDGKSVFNDITLNGLWTGWSGFDATFSDDHRAKIEEMLEQGMGWESQYVEIDCYRLDTLLSKHSLKEVDYLAISTEGHELVVLKSINWGAVDVQVIEVAVDEHTLVEIDAYLRSKGYTHRPLSAEGRDRVYVKAE